MFSFLHDGQKHIISLVGGGGKTTLLYQLAAYYAAAGRATLVATTTHILPPKEHYAASLAEARRLWQQGCYAVCGQVEAASGKLVAPPDLEACLGAAAIALLEADGAKGRPTKLPGEGEPVLLPSCDSVVAVFGLDALGRPLQEVCFRSHLAPQALQLRPDSLLGLEEAARLLTAPTGSRKGVGCRSYYVLLNKCDSPGLREAGEALRERLLALGLGREEVALRGSWGDFRLD